jgi:hypothetical protein
MEVNGMSKMVKVVGIAVVIVGVLGAGFLAVAPASAQTNDPVLPGGGPANGYGGQGVRAGFGISETTQAALAEALGVSVEELQAAFEAASDPGDVPEALGISQEAFQAAMQEVMQAAHGTANQWAAEDGPIAREQANWACEDGIGPRGGTYSDGGLRLFGAPTGE